MSWGTLAYTTRAAANRIRHVPFLCSESLNFRPQLIADELQNFCLPLPLFFLPFGGNKETKPFIKYTAKPGPECGGRIVTCAQQLFAAVDENGMNDT